MRTSEKARVGVLATHGFEYSELTEPMRAAHDTGADVDIISLDSEPIRSWKDSGWGEQFTVDVTVDQARVDDYDVLVLPGGTINPDKLRRDERAVRFVREFVDSGKPVAAICHGPWMLVEADVLRNRGSPRSTQSGRTLRMPARTGLMRKSSSMTTLSRVAIRMTCRHLTTRSSKPP